MKKPLGEEVCDVPTCVTEGEVLLVIAIDVTPFLQGETIGLIELIGVFRPNGGIPEGTAEDVLSLIEAAEIFADFEPGVLVGGTRVSARRAFRVVFAHLRNRLPLRDGPDRGSR